MELKKKLKKLGAYADEEKKGHTPAHTLVTDVGWLLNSNVDVIVGRLVE